MIKTGILYYNESKGKFYDIIGIIKGSDTSEEEIINNEPVLLSLSDDEFFGVYFDEDDLKYYKIVDGDVLYIEREEDIFINLSDDEYNCYLNSNNNTSFDTKRVIKYSVIDANYSSIPRITYEVDINSNTAVYTFTGAYNITSIPKSYIDIDQEKIEDLDSYPVLDSSSVVNNFDVGLVYIDLSNTIYLIGEYQVNINLLPLVSIMDSNGNISYLATSVEINDNIINPIFNELNSLSAGSYYIYLPQGALSNGGDLYSPEIIIPFTLTLLQSGGGDTPSQEVTFDYVNYPNNLNEGSGETFGGLLKFYNTTSEITPGSASVRRHNNTLLINNSVVKGIKVLPTIKTTIQYTGGPNTGQTALIVYTDSITPITVTVTLDMRNGTDRNIKIYNIPYNELHDIPLSDFVEATLKLEFKINDAYLSRTMQFYKVPNFTTIANLNSDFSILNPALGYFPKINTYTGTPVEEVWGSLLLTNSYDVIETERVLITQEEALLYDSNEIIEEGENLFVIKGVAELVPTTKVRMGNLAGIYNETFGANQPRGYGLYGESVYLTGNFYLNNGRSLVDINNDVTLAVGDINRIRQLLNSLDNSLHDSIYYLTIEQALNNANAQENINNINNEINNLSSQIQATAGVTANFSNVIKNNTLALFKLGKDYALWAVGNAGISIINPNVRYNSDGTIDDSTVGDADEFLLLQGESVQIINNITSNNRVKVICSSIDPHGFTYGDNDLFRPSNAAFKIGWVKKSELQYFGRDSVFQTSVNLDESGLVTTNQPKPYRYVALEDHINSNSGSVSILDNAIAITRSTDLYQFSTYLFVPEGSNPPRIYTTATTSNLYVDGSNYKWFVYDVTTTGLFTNGKFSANLIDASQLNIENVVARVLSNRNDDFDPALPVSSSNLPYTSEHNDLPYAVISGTTGKITGQGIDIKEATIGDSTGDNEHIRISDNKGILVGYVYNGSNVTDTKPAMYFKKGSDVVVKVSSDDSKEILKFFNNTSTTLSDNQTKTLFNGATIKYSRLLDITNASIIAEDANGNEGTYTNYSEFGTFDGDNYFFTKVDKTQAYSSNLTYYKKNGTSFVVADATDIELNSNVDIYRRSGLSFYYNEFIPTRANTQVTGENGGLYHKSNCYHSDIGKISYNKTSGTLTSSSDIGSYRTFIAGKNYEISGSANINLENLSSVLRYKKLSVNDGLMDISKLNQITEESSYVSGLADLIAGSFEIKLSIVLVNINDSDDRKTLKIITYGISNYNFSEYGDITYNSYTKINNLTNPTTNTISSSIPSITKKSYNHFGNSIKFSKIVNFNSNGNYKIVLEASVLFLQTGWMSQYRCNSHVDNNPSGSINSNDFITPSDISSNYYSFDNGSNSYSEGIPMSNDYEWYPLLCPKEYEIRPQINITNCTIRLIEIKDKTIILANGLLSGYESSNQFSITFNQSADFINFKKAEFVKGVGHILNQNGSHNAFILADGSEKLIKLPIPILYGSFVPKITKPLYSSHDYPNNYYYYQFSGYSLIENTTLYANNHGGPDGDWYLTSSNFSILQVSPGNYIEISGFLPHWRDLNITTLYGTIYYMKDYDIYLCTNKDPGTQVCLFFGEHWNSLFTLFGTNVFATVTPKYARLGSNDLVGFSRVPIIVNNTAVYKNTTLKYRTTNSEGTLSNTDLSINTKVGFEFSSIDVRNTFVYNSDNPSLSYNKIVPVRGYFDVMIYYIPETT